MHEDYQDQAIPIDFGLQHLHIHVLSPVDLAVSKIARLAGNDLEDIQSLVRQGLTNSHAIAQRAKSVSSNKNVSYKAPKKPKFVWHGPQKPHKRAFLHKNTPKTRWHSDCK